MLNVTNISYYKNFLLFITTRYDFIFIHKYTFVFIYMYKSFTSQKVKFFYIHLHHVRRCVSIFRMLLVLLYSPNSFSYSKFRHFRFECILGTGIKPLSKNLYCQVSPTVYGFTFIPITFLLSDFWYKKDNHGD